MKKPPPAPRTEFVNDIAKSGDLDELWRSVSKLVFTWAVHFRQSCKPATIDVDDLVGEASVKFMVCAKCWKSEKGDFLAYLKACTMRHWLLLSKRNCGKMLSADFSRLPTSCRAKFGLPDGDSEGIGGSADEVPAAVGGQIGAWDDRDSYYDDKDQCEQLLGLLNADDAAVLRNWMYAGRQNGIQIGGALNRAKKILGKRDQPLLFS